MAFEGPHADLSASAIAHEAAAHRALLDGDAETARRELLAAVAAYRASWEVAPPGSWGRLIGMLKAAILAGPQEAAAAARIASGAVGPQDTSPPAAYVVALCGLILRDDAAAIRGAEGMCGGTEAFVRTADAIEALALLEAERYADAVAEIVTSFETRDEHLTGVAIADTALMLQCLAAERGLDARPGPSPVLPG